MVVQRGMGVCINRDRNRDYHCVLLVSQDSVIFLPITTAQGHDVRNVQTVFVFACVCVSHSVYSEYLCGWQCVYAALKACACFIRFKAK